MNRTQSMIACAALAAACAAPEYADDSAGTGKMDDLREDGTTFFVYANGRACISDPCPVYTAITPGAVKFDLSNIDADRIAGEDVERIEDGGMLVRGELDVGSWEPGGDGTALLIEEAVAPADEFLVWPHAGGPGFTAIGISGAKEHPHDIDVEDLRSSGKREPTLSGLAAGDWAARGFVGHSDTGAIILFATRVAGWSWPCTVFASGIECVTAPCPTWTMIDPEGAPLGNAASIDMRYLRLEPERELTIRAKIAQMGADVRAWVSDGEWAPGERGDVLYVIGTDGGEW